MVSELLKRLHETKGNLDRSLVLFEGAKTREEKELFFLTLTKAFEVLVEYGWRHFRICVRDEGLEVVSPKEAVRQAAKLGFLDDPKEWMEFINVRNNSVHDYFGISQNDFILLAKDLSKSTKEILSSTEK